MYYEMFMGGDKESAPVNQPSSSRIQISERTDESLNERVDDAGVDSFVPVPGASKHLGKGKKQETNAATGSDFNYSITMKSNKFNKPVAPVPVLGKMKSSGT